MVIFVGRVTIPPMTLSSSRHAITSQKLKKHNEAIDAFSEAHGDLCFNMTQGFGKGQEYILTSSKGTDGTTTVKTVKGSSPWILDPALVPCIHAKCDNKTSENTCHNTRGCAWDVVTRAPLRNSRYLMHGRGDCSIIRPPSTPAWVTACHATTIQVQISRSKLNEETSLRVLLNITPRLPMAPAPHRGLNALSMEANKKPFRSACQGAAAPGRQARREGVAAE